MSSAALLIVASAVALSVAWVVAFAARGLARSYTGGSSVFWAAAALAPAVAAVLTAVALLTPEPFAQSCHCALHGNHHPHLCWSHPQYATSLALPALALLGVWFVSRVPALAATVSLVVRSRRLAARIREAPAAAIDGIVVHRLDCGEPTAFTAGLWTPLIVVDRALAERLDVQSLRAVVHHEHAHALRRDGLAMAALRFAAAWFPGRWLGAVVERWAAVSEIECDRHAAMRLGNAADVAAALVKVERLRAAAPPPAISFAPGIAAPNVERRVRTLLCDGARAPNLANDAISVGIVAIGLSLLAALWPGDALHHLVETLLGALL